MSFALSACLIIYYLDSFSPFSPLMPSFVPFAHFTFATLFALLPRVTKDSFCFIILSFCNTRILELASVLNYPNIFNQFLGQRGFVQVINLSCPADSTETMLDGNKGTTLYPVGSLCYGNDTLLPPALNLDGNISSAECAIYWTCYYHFWKQRFDK